MRQKKILPRVLDKYINFFYDLSDPAYSGTSLKYLVQSASINKSVIKAMKDLKVIEWTDDNNWRLLIEEDFKKSALELLNYCLELGKKQIVTPIYGLDNEIKGYIKAIHDHLISNANKQNITVDGPKLPLLSRALIQDTHTNLFSQIESNESKKFELLKAIASGVYTKVDGLTNEIDIDVYNSGIIDATEDLFNKFFSKK